MVPRTEQEVENVKHLGEHRKEGKDKGQVFPFPNPGDSYLSSGEPQRRVQVLLGVEQSRGALGIRGADAGVQCTFGDGNICWDSRFSLCVCFFKHKEMNH